MFAFKIVAAEIDPFGFDDDLAPEVADSERRGFLRIDFGSEEVVVVIALGFEVTVL